MKLSLTARIYLFAIVCVGLVLASQALVYPFVVRPELARREVASDRMLVRLFESVAPERARQVVPTLTSEGTRDLALLDADGQVIASGGTPTPGLDAATRDAVRARGRVRLADHAVAYPVGDSGRFLVIRRNVVGVRGRAMTLLLVCLIVPLLLLSWAFARGLARPLRRIAAAARALGSGELGARVAMSRRDELGTVANAFDQMAGQIATLVANERMLFAGISHELRTPMARIRVAVDVAAQDPAAAQEMLAGVGEDLTELELLVEDALTMTRLASGAGVPLREEAVTPEALVESSHDRWRRIHGGRELAIDVEAGLPTLRGDPVMLRRVLDNLLDNAVRHADASPVRLRARRGDAKILFEVTDHGPGLDDQERAQAFQPFWRSEASRTREANGLGLGLPLARQIARAHGGEVMLHPDASGGTTATLSVPVS